MATILFVCPHGAGKSRMAAAFFNERAAADWRATSAGQEPQATLGTNAVRLLAGTTADPFLDRELPRPIAAVAAPTRVVAIDCDVPGAERWNLTNQQFDEALREELRARVEALLHTLPAMTRERGMRWITRARVKVDRVACPWLIKHFIDATAEFIFVAPEEVARVAAERDAIPYDVSGVELGHHGPFCSFDAILSKYGLTDPALLSLAAIVRGADTDDKDLTPESRGLEAIAEGFRRMAQAGGYDDHETNRREWIVYDALYLACGGDPARLGLGGRA